MPFRRWARAITLIVTAFAFSSVMTAPAWGSSERLAAIPLPAALRPHLSAACHAWGKHIEELIEQHRFARELTDEETDKATTLFYVAKAYCSSDSSPPDGAYARPCGPRPPGHRERGSRPQPRLPHLLINAIFDFIAS